jgi:hypothetical protein
MQRLVLALIFAVVAVAAAAVAVRVVRAAWVSVDGAVQAERSGGDTMQKLAFFLLIGLILYVSVLGGA